jgi:hypothetical protein
MSIASGGAVTFTQTPVFPDGSLALADLDIDGGTDIGAAIVDADLFIVDDGAGGTNRKTTAARLKTYIGGGIENISTYRMTTNTTLSSGINFIDSNWSVYSVALGTAVGESSGTFSFPQTGYWKIEANHSFYRMSGDSAYVGLRMYVTTNNSNYTTISNSYSHLSSEADQHASVYNSTVIDVTDISNQKVRIYYESEIGSTIRLIGTANSDATYVRFIRLAGT